VNRDKERKGEARADVLARVAQEGHWSRRNVVFASTALTAASALGVAGRAPAAEAQQPAGRPASGRPPNILVIFGDDIGQTNISAYSHGVMGYRTSIAWLRKA
jgi:arylsulfatase